MILTLNFKTPDVIYQALNDALIRNKDIREELTEELELKIRYGEYLTVYYDTETKQLSLT